MIEEVLDLISTVSPVWMRKAHCADTDPDLFYTHPGEDGEHDRAAEAVAVCKRCPVQVECLKWAIRENDEWGILGGKTPRERKEILRGRTPRLAHLRTVLLTD